MIVSYNPSCVTSLIYYVIGSYMIGGPRIIRMECTRIFSRMTSITQIEGPFGNINHFESKDSYFLHVFQCYALFRIVPPQTHVIPIVATCSFVGSIYESTHSL